MTENSNEHRVKYLIIFLSILLGISLVSLTGIILHNLFTGNSPSTVVVPDNVITPDKEGTTNPTPSPGDSPGPSSSPVPSDNPGSTDTPDDNSITDDHTNGGNTAAPSKTPEPTAIDIYLHSKNAGDNRTFNAVNMFPGDKEISRYCLRVSYHDSILVYFKADIRNGYEKLAEVMKVKVTLLDRNEIMYDGLMKDMPDSVSKKLTSSSSTTDELYYEIIAYLDTSVGNDYMEQDLVADFKWWAEDTGNLNPPKTGVNPDIISWILIAGTSLVMILILLASKKKVERGA